MANQLLFEGEAMARFRMTQVEMDNILFTFCVLSSQDDRWVSKTFVPGAATERQYWKMVSKGKPLGIHDRLTGYTHYIHSENIMQGVSLWLESGEGTIVNGKIEIQFDDVIADRIFQYAIFGEVKYE